MVIKFTPAADILLLQDHQLSEQECITTTSQLPFPKGMALWNNTRFIIWTNRLAACTTIIFSPALSPPGIIFYGYTKWVKLRLALNFLLGIINLYGYNLFNNIAILWDNMALFPLPEAHWILGGDFNKIDSLDDKISGTLTIGISRTKHDSLYMLLVVLSLQDIFRVDEFITIGNKSYSWNNRHTWVHNVMTWINKFLFS